QKRGVYPQSGWVKPQMGGRHSRSPSVVSLTVETALCSFDFLNTSDCEEEDEGVEERGEKRSRSGRSLQDRGWDSPPSPLTTGCTTLDCALVVHLNKCSTQLLCLGMFGPLRCGEMYALDRLLREAQVLETIRRIAKDNPRHFRQPAEDSQRWFIFQPTSLIHEHNARIITRTNSSDHITPILTQLH
ncbi:protein FAM65A-like, partial [Notothenia coriiceps]|uniref:Protein FAM65A-like n=1 Tax=Notothenia coriiceps TaxID=8208 RepID=A0A6I9MHT4_9TELE